MLPDDRHFLTCERQNRLLHEAATDHLAHLIPRGLEVSLRERVAGMLIALAIRIAPSVTIASLRSLTSRG